MHPLLGPVTWITGALFIVLALVTAGIFAASGHPLGAPGWAILGAAVVAMFLSTVLQNFFRQKFAQLDEDDGESQLENR